LRIYKLFKGGKYSHAILFLKPFLYVLVRRGILIMIQI
jgi:hypothetical protein